MTEGGDGTNGWFPSTEQRQHLSEVYKGKKQSAEAIKKQADKLRNRIWVHIGTDRKMIYKEELDTYLANGWDTGTGIDPYQSKAVVCYETGEEFKSRTAANKKYHGALKYCLLHEYWRTCAGYHWYFKTDLKRKKWLEENIEVPQAAIIKTIETGCDLDF